MVPEIWSATDRILLSSWTIFCHFSPLTAWKMKTSKMKKKPGDIIILHKYTKNPYHWLYCSWDMVCYGCNCYFHFRLYFSLLLPPPPSNSPKNENFKTMKMAGDIILHNCTKNHDHMLYCSWDAVCDGCNCYFSFWAILFPFTLLTAQKKWKIQNNEKKAWGYHFTQVYQI